MRELLTLVVIVTTAAIAPRTAEACSPVDPYFTHTLEAAHAGDHASPGPVTATAEIYYRRGDGGGCEPSCGGYGTRIVLSPTATDDATPSDRIGYRLAVVGGAPPTDLKLPVWAVEPAYGDIGLTFRDPGAFAFELEIRAVDLNNNLGPPMVITIASDGDPDDGGCSAGSSAPPLGVALGVLTLCALAVRPRRPADQGEMARG